MIAGRPTSGVARWECPVGIPPISRENVRLDTLSTSTFSYIDNQAGLDALTRIAEQSGRIALDTEANSLHNYYERVCLLQVSIGDEHFIVDPLSDVDTSAFLDVLKQKVLILHGADYDLRLLRQTFGLIPKGNVFDTMLAAQLLGFERFGYAALIEHFFGVKLSKSGQKSNWAKRPLTEAQLRYAADDTRYLGGLADLLLDELEDQGRTDWHLEWCAKVVASTRQDNARNNDEAWRIRGLGGLGRRELAFLREVWSWRDKEARKSDRPPFKIIGNQQLTDLAVWASENAGAPLSDGPRLPRHCEGRRLRALEQSIRRADCLPRAEWPEKRRRRESSVVRAPESKNRLEALRAECVEVASELGIPASVLAPKAMLAAIAREGAMTRAEIKECCGMMDWQMSLLEDRIRRILTTVEG